MEINNHHSFFTGVDNIKKNKLCVLTVEICIVLNIVYGCLVACIFSNGMSWDYKLLNLRTKLEIL